MQAVGLLLNFPPALREVDDDDHRCVDDDYADSCDCQKVVSQWSSWLWWEQCCEKSLLSL